MPRAGLRARASAGLPTRRSGVAPTGPAPVWRPVDMGKVWCIGCQNFALDPTQEMISTFLNRANDGSVTESPVVQKCARCR